MSSPIINGDESGYLGNARFLVQGFGRTHMGYAAGYSLLLVPPAVLSHDPLTAYHLSLIVNALLAASLAPLAYFLARRVAPEARGAALIGCALVVVLYPGWSAFSNLVLTENATVPAVLAVACVISVARQSPARWCLAASIAAYVSWVTPRGILVVAAFAVACVVSTRPWRARLPGLPPLLVAIGLTVLGRLVNLQVTGSSQLRGSDGSSSRIVETLRHSRLWGPALANVIGWLTYTGVATFGVAIVGSVVLIRAVVLRSGRSSDPLAPVAVFVLSALFSTLVFGALDFVSVPVARLDLLIYGRYIDGVLAPVLVVGAVWLFDRKTSVARRHDMGYALGIGASLVVATALFTFLRPRANPGVGLNPANVLALRVYFVHVHASLSWVLLAAVGVTTLVLLFIAFDRRVGAMVLFAALALSSWVAYFDYVLPGSTARASQRVLVEGMQRLHALGVETSCVTLDRASPPVAWNVNNYQFLVPASSFSSADAGDSTCGPLVLSADPDLERRIAGARPVSYEDDVPIALWILTARVPQSVRDTVDRAGLMGPVPLTAGLPGAAYRSSIEVVPQVTTTARLRLLVHLTHVGAGAPWPGSRSTLQHNGVGRVRLLVSLVETSGAKVVSARCPIPRTMLPGDKLDIECEVPIAHLRLPSGAYMAHVGLIQEGVTLFSTKGDADAIVPVTLAPGPGR